jgi:hypothetical protein
MSRRGGGGGGGGNGAKIPSGATGGGPAVPVPPYNPLLDRNLAGYFSSARVQRQLQGQGLVDASGRILTEVPGQAAKVHVVSRELERMQKDSATLARDEADLRVSGGAAQAEGARDADATRRNATPRHATPRTRRSRAARASASAFARARTRADC